MAKIQELWRMAWRLLCEACGENEYARYLAAANRRGDAPLSPEAFYLSRLEAKYSRPNRCC
ncbi:MAG TPA: CstA-like transporter-associated (seleno)protein [Terriglobia bacterium]|nr:CstA-like transporter-associated (seleno)protein [Terriglobia bacterium]